uniref:Uncharacterized protein n=1 Tax=Stomoxys calcitrans TaxID=35570 RepID=A0A1I8NZI3_STOCA
MKILRLLIMSSHQIVFPKPIPQLDLQSLPNENGFTLTEIAGLHNGWRLIKRRFSYHSKRIFKGYMLIIYPLIFCNI